MALTVTEKEHWKARIARKISQAVEELLDRTNPDYLKEMAATARKEAIAALGIGKLLAEERLYSCERKRIDARKEEVVRGLLAIVRGDDSKSITATYGWEDEVERAVQRMQQPLEQKLLAADELGRQILQLRREEEELLDTVWLATSPQQIRDLWRSVSELVAGELTPLQEQALRTPAPESEHK